MIRQNNRYLTIWAAVIVILPIACIITYEIAVRDFFKWRSLMEILVEPIAREAIRVEQPLDIAAAPEDDVQEDGSGSVATGDTIVETSSQSGSGNIATSQVDSSSNEEKAEDQKEYDELVANDTEHPALHTGVVQDGLFIPNLILSVDYKELVYLLQRGNAALFVELEDQVYHLTSKERKQPFAKTELHSLRSRKGLSDRYVPVSRNHIEPNQLGKVDNLVYTRTGLKGTPAYKLFFTNTFNNHMIAVQLAKARELNLDLEDLAKKKRSVTMRGRLIQGASGLELLIISVDVSPA